MKPRLTNSGIAAQIKELDGTGITFSKIKLGNGTVPTDYKVMTDLQNPLVTVGLSSMSEVDEGYVELVGVFNNSGLETSFYWTEVGIFIQDPDDENSDLLYAYGHVDLEEEPEMAASIPAGGTEVYEIELTYRVYVGEAEDISAIIAESSIYATKEQLDAHENDQTNPHNVTASQVGLGNVPNVSTDDQTPTVTEAVTLTNLSSGDTMGTIIGKIKKAITDLITHIGNNNSHVSSTDRTNWNGKAAGKHNHDAANITSGLLGIARGGTGGGTAQQARQNLGISSLVTQVTGRASGRVDVMDSISATFQVPSGYKVLSASNVFINSGGRALIGIEVRQNGSTGTIEAHVVTTEDDEQAGSTQPIDLFYGVNLIRDI